MSLASWVPPGGLLGVSWIPRHLKMAQNRKIPQHPQNTCSKNAGACFLRPQEAATQTHRAGRPLDMMELHKYTII